MKPLPPLALPAPPPPKRLLPPEEGGLDMMEIYWAMRDGIPWIHRLSFFWHARRILWCEKQDAGSLRYDKNALFVDEVRLMRNVRVGK